MKKGICHICLEEKPLTFEHYPPSKSFNNGRVLIGDKISQKGIGGYTLCEKCNNLTGGWYNNDFLKLSFSVHNILEKEQLDLKDDITGIGITLKDVNPLYCAKQMLSSICNLIPIDELKKYNFRELLLEKDKCLEKPTFELFVSLYANKEEGTLFKGPILLNGSDRVYCLCSYPFQILFVSKTGYSIKGFSSFNPLLQSIVHNNISYTFNIGYSKNNIFDFIKEAIRRV